MRSVVVMGGGTGTHTLLRGLKRFSHRLQLAAIVNMSDSGGSTGRLRDEFGLLPVGDARMALAALADDTGRNELLLRDLFLYRFQNGDGLKGHNLGNLLLAALADLLGSEAAAISAASRILRVAGAVMPVTADDVELTAVYDDGLVAEGESLIDDPPAHRQGRRIASLGLKPSATVAPEAAAALKAAALVILGPGDLYSSLLANCVVGGVPEALKESPARLVYVANLMERLGQTEGMSVSDCVSEIAKYAGRAPDIVLVNNAPLPADAVRHYKEEEGTRPVVDDLESGQGITVIRADLAAEAPPAQAAADQVKRSLIRHDPEKLAAAIWRLFDEV